MLLRYNVDLNIYIYCLRAMWPSNLIHMQNQIHIQTYICVTKVHEERVCLHSLDLPFIIISIA